MSQTDAAARRIEGVAEAEHKIALLTEIEQLVADVDEEGARDVGLQVQHLITPSCLRRTGEYHTYAGIDGEYRHNELGARRQSRIYLTEEFRAEETDIVRFRALCPVMLQVGALIPLEVCRQSGAEITANLIHGHEVDSGYSEMPVEQHRILPSPVDTLADSAVSHKIIAETLCHSHFRCILLDT